MELIVHRLVQYIVLKNHVMTLTVSALPANQDFMVMIVTTFVQTTVATESVSNLQVYVWIVLKENMGTIVRVLAQMAVLKTSVIKRTGFAHHANVDFMAISVRKRVQITVAIKVVTNLQVCVWIVL